MTIKGAKVKIFSPGIVTIYLSEAKI